MFRAASIVALAGSLLLSVAFAADLPPIGAASPTPVPVATPYWEGFYAGPSLGQAYTPGVGRAGREGDFIGGGQLGYTWQAGVPVFGVEADLGGLNGSAIDKLASLRARAGLALGRVMLYGTFGVAGLATRARVELANTPFGPDVLTNRSQTRAGVVAGAGVEAFISEAMSLKAEYLYGTFGDYDAFSSLSGGRVRSPLDAHVVRVGLNYHFNGKRPLDVTLKGFRPYVGGGSYVHHTGRDGVHPVSTEKYEAGGKAFAGAFLNDWAAVEVGYNHLGRAPATRLTPLGLVGTREASSAVTASVATFSDPLFSFFDWMRSAPELRLFSRGRRLQMDRGARRRLFGPGRRSRPQRRRWTSGGLPAGFPARRIRIPVAGANAPRDRHPPHAAFRLGRREVLAPGAPSRVGSGAGAGFSRSGWSSGSPSAATVRLRRGSPPTP